MALQARIELDINKLEQVVSSRVNAGMASATLEAHSYISKKISVTQPIHVSHPGRHKRGLNPSKPGEYPKVVERRLLQSLQFKITKGSRFHSGRVLADTDYARYLELGGRSFLRRGVREDLTGIGEAFIKGAQLG